MARTIPTEAPDKPVNRLLPYLPKEDLPSGGATFDLLPTPPLTPGLREELLRDLTHLSARYEADPSSPAVVKEIIRCLHRLREFEQMLSFVGYFQALSSMCDPEIEALAQAAMQQSEDDLSD